MSNRKKEKTKRKFEAKVRFLRKSCLFGLLITQVSCFSSDYEAKDLTNRMGFDNGSAVVQPPVKTSQDYYYRQGNGGGAPNNPNPYGAYNSQTNTPYQYPQQQYYAPSPYVAAPYQVYPGTSSRSYSNPYAIPPSQYYPQYDADQYYIPPNSVGADENRQQFNNRY